MYYLAQEFCDDAVFESIGTFSTNNPWRHAYRTVSSFELIFVVEGILPIEIAGKKQEVAANEMIVIPPHTPHGGFRETEGKLVFIWLHFASDAFQEIDEARLTQELTEKKSEKWVVFPNRTDRLEIERMFLMANQLLDLYQGRVGERYLNHFLICILDELTFQTIRMLTKERVGKEDIQPIQDWIRTYATEDISLQDVAEYFNYNKNYLSQKYKQHFGLSVNQQIIHYRLTHAKSLLTTTNKTIQEIAFEVGYEDEKYFMRLFKEREKTTPTKYRQTFSKRHYNHK